MKKNSEQVIRDRVLKTIKDKYKAKSVHIASIHTGSYIMIKNEYDNETIYVKRETDQELDDFISGYFACWSDMQ